jgi:hypothetical protein
MGAMWRRTEPASQGGQFLNLVDLNTIVPFGIGPGIEDCAFRAGNRLGHCGFLFTMHDIGLRIRAKCNR